MNIIILDWRFDCRALGISRWTSCLPSQAWLVTDCCGIVCAVFTYLLIFYAFFVVNRVMIGPLEDSYTSYKWFHGIIYNMMSFLAFSAHARAMLSDPVSTCGYYCFATKYLSPWYNLS